VRPALVAIVAVITACGSDPVRPVSTATAIAIDFPRLVLGGRESAQATAVAFDAAGAVVHSATVRWSSSNPAVATVTPNGMVTAVSGGQAR